LAVWTVSGCGDKKTTVTCEPACPAGTHCAESGCVIDQAASDAAVATGADLTAGCFPACGGDTPHCNAQNLCVPCITDDHCPIGSVCKALGPTTVCIAGCKDDGRCGGGSLKCCDGQCTDESTDPSNCGACGTACMAAHGAPACVAGGCTTGACAAGWKDCNASSQDGCEVNTGIDPNNCGACGTTCTIANALPGCSGSCYIAACSFGWDDCNAESGDGCEQNVVDDPKNCGACGNSCSDPPHGKITCQNAGCVLASCVNGFSDCDGNPANGCEVATGTDNSNCGACGNVCGQGLVCRNGACTCPACNFPNAKSRCANNQCILGDCLPGWGDCNKVAKDGCEVDLTADANNCNGCGNACPPDAPYCLDSQCSMGCLGGMPAPDACTTGTDLETASPWIVCAADCKGAYIAANNGGNYHALQICQTLGYSKLGSYGGTCGTVCGFCKDWANASCMNPQPNPHFDGGGNQGMDGFGIILANTVQWQCLP